MPKTDFAEYVVKDLLTKESCRISRWSKAAGKLGR